MRGLYILIDDTSRVADKYTILLCCPQNAETRKEPWYLQMSSIQRVGNTLESNQNSDDLSKPRKSPQHNTLNHPTNGQLLQQ